MQLFAGFEANSLARRDRDFRAGAGIPSDAGFPRAHVKHAEPTQFDTVASSQSFLEAFKHRVDGDLRLVSGEPGPFDYVMNYVLFNQRIRLGFELVDSATVHFR